MNEKGFARIARSAFLFFIVGIGACGARDNSLRFWLQANSGICFIHEEWSGAVVGVAVESEGIPIGIRRIIGRANHGRAIHAGLWLAERAFLLRVVVKRFSARVVRVGSDDDEVFF